MESREKNERPLMSEEEFKKFLEERKEAIQRDIVERGVLPLRQFSAVSRYKSVARAYKRGHISLTGDVYPKRPFNNRPNTSRRKGRHSRVMNELKRNIYEQYKSTAA